MVVIKLLSRKLSEKVTSFISELVRGARDIKMLNSEDSFIDELSLKINASNNKKFEIEKTDKNHKLLFHSTFDLFDFFLMIFLILLLRQGITIPTTAIILHNYSYNVNGFMSILGPKFIDHFRDRIINVHPSLIPSFCGQGFYGLKVHEAALSYGVKVTGATVHFVNEIPDGGKIILQKAVDIMDGDTPEVLQKRVMEQAEWILLPKAAELVAASITG